MNILGGVLRGVIAVVMIGLVVVFALWLWRITEPMVPGGESKCEGVQSFEVKPDQTVQQVADGLQSAGIIDNAFFFVTRLRLSGAERKLQAGTFQLECSQDYDTVIRVLTTPREAATVDFQVIEGLRLEEVAERLGEKGVLSPTNFLQKTASPEGALPYIESYGLLKAAGIPEDHGLEGFLFPDTYQAKQDPSGDSTDPVIKKMLETFEIRLNSLNETDILGDVAKRQIMGEPVTLYQVVTLASIVQREAAVESEMPEIAQVYWNRMTPGKLPDGAPALLNADPTIQYALGKPGKWWPELTLEDLKIDSPYNSYTNALLPPGPICNPGLAAIRATVYPSGSENLYFVAKCDGSGEHFFARTLEEHNVNVARCPR